MRLIRCWDEAECFTNLYLKGWKYLSIYIYIYMHTYIHTPIHAYGAYIHAYIHKKMLGRYTLTQYVITLSRTHLVTVIGRVRTLFTKRINREQNFLACRWHQCTLKLSYVQGFIKEAHHCIGNNLSRVNTREATSFLLISYVTAMKVLVPLSPTPTACRKLQVSTEVSGKSTNWELGNTPGNLVLRKAEPFS